MLNEKDSVTTESATYGVRKAHQMLQVATSCVNRGTARRVIGEAIQEMEEAIRSLRVVLERGKRHAD